MRILLLEDDKKLAGLVSQYLSHSFVVDIVNNIDEANYNIEQFEYNIALLDRNIDGKDIGMDLIKKIKQKSANIGVIVTSAYDTINDKINGLNLGADDYLEKPYDNAELEARIYAISRRFQGTPKIMVEGLECDTNTKTIKFHEEIVNLSQKESKIFFYLLNNRGNIVTKEQLLYAVYENPQNITSNTLDVTIKNIRKKLPIDIIKTVKTRGVIIE